MKTIYTFIVLCTAVIYGSYGQQQWGQTSTPPGGSVWAMANIGSDIFAGTTSGGVYYSANGGVNWFERNGNTPGFEVFSFAVDGTDLYAGLSYNGTNNIYGIYKTTDKGLNWTKVTPNGMNSGDTVRDMVVHGGFLYACAGDIVYKSPLASITEFTWTNFSTSLPSNSIRSLAVASNGSNHELLAGTYGFGVWKSSTTTANWTPTLGMGAASDYIQTLLTDGNYAYAGNISGLPVLYNSSDYGDMWSSSSDNTFNDKPVYSLLNCGGDIYAGTEGHGILVSSNNGNSWSEYNSGFRDSEGNWYCNQINVRSMICVGSEIYAGTDCGVWKRSNGTLGIDSNEDYNFTFSPNPTYDFVNIPMEMEAKYSLITLRGKLLQQGSLIIGNNSLDISSYPSGIYIIRIEIDGITDTLKVIKR